MEIRLLVPLMALAVFALAACGGVSQSKYDAAISARDGAQAEANTARQQAETAQAEAAAAQQRAEAAQAQAGVSDAARQRAEAAQAEAGAASRRAEAAQAEADAARQRAEEALADLRQQVGLTDMDSDGVVDARDFYPARANSGLAAGDVEPRRAAAGETLSDLLADPRNTFRAYSATVRYARRDGERHSMRLTDRYSVSSVVSDGDFGFRVTWRDENSDTLQTTVHLRKNDLDGSTYTRDFGDAGSYGYWALNGSRPFTGTSYPAPPFQSHSLLRFPRGHSRVLYGLETPIDSVPTGTATYSGIIHAYSYDNALVRSLDSFSASDIRSAHRGSLRLDMNLADNSLSGRIEEIHTRGPGESTYSNRSATTGFDITEGRISGAQFTATMSGTDSNPSAALADSMRGYEGGVIGSFFGPNAEAADGVFAVSRNKDGNDRVMIGGLYSRKQ